MQLTDKYAPKQISDFAGLETPKAIFENFVAEPYTSAWLLVGPTGIGKTSMGLAVQNAIGGTLYHIPSRQCDLATVEELLHKCQYKPWHGRFNTVLVDECDQATKAAQLAFLSILDATSMPEDTVFIFTANSTDKLEDRFMNRCRVVEFTNVEIDFREMLEYIWSQEAMGRPAPDYDRIIARSKGSVRGALMELETALLTSKPKAKPTRTETRWLNAAGESLGWEVIEQRIANGDFTGIRFEEVEVYA